MSIAEWEVHAYRIRLRRRRQAIIMNYCVDSDHRKLEEGGAVDRGHQRAKGLSATFFLYVEAFLLRFSCGGRAFFHLLKAFLLLFFSMWQLFLVLWGPFLACPPLQKFRRGLMPAYPLTLDWRQCGNSLALCYFAVVMELPDSLLMNCKSEFGVIFLRCSPT